MSQQSLSSLQRAILDLLPVGAKTTVPTGAVIAGLGIERPTIAQRVAVSKSLKRLSARGLVYRWETPVARPGRGSLWSRASRV